MWDPPAIVPNSIMPAYRHMWSNVADIETAYAEAVTVKNAFGVPYGKEIKKGKAAWEAHKPKVLAEAMAIAKDFKGEKADEVRAMIKEGKVPEIVALIAYLNRLK